MNRSITRSPPWKIIIDSGATSHVFSNKSFIFDYEPIESCVETGSGELLKCPGRGKAKIDLEGPNGNIDAMIKDVIWCPDLGHNLLSTLPLGRRGVEVFLRVDGRPSEFWKNDKVFGYADIIDNQYVVRGDAYQVNQANIIVSPQLLHQRMGHLNWQSVMQVPYHATGIEIQGKKPEEVCGGCMLGHQQKKIGHAPMPKATELFQLIHTDLSGPFPVTRQGHKYYISFLDDLSGAIHIHLLKTKDDALAKFMEYKAKMELQSGKKIKFVRSDGGGEYKNLGFEASLKEAGIQWEPTAAYNPNQNGKAERVNYTLMSVVRSILSSKKLPKVLWGELVLTAAFLRNRSPRLDKPSAFELVNGFQPDLSHLKVIGSRTWVYIPKEKRKKMDERSWQGILVGYEPATSNYRVYDPIKGKVHVVHSINVDENNLYDRSQVDSKEFADEDWQESDDDEFGNPELPDIDEPLSNRTYAESFDPPMPSRPTNQPAEEDTAPVGADNQEVDTQSEGEYYDARSRGRTTTTSPDPVSNDLAAAPVFDPPEPNQAAHEEPVLRRSTRRHSPVKYNQPDRFGDIRYDKAFTASTTFDPNATLDSHCFMHRVLLMLQNGIGQEGSDEPETLEEAKKRSDWPKWQEAMKAEYDSHIENGTWELTNAPADRKVLTGRWVFKLKKDRYGNILKYKARWVVHGYKQKYGLDYEDTFATVVKPMSYKALIALSALRGLKIRQMDVVTAFLLGFLDETIYVEQPHQFVEGTKVCRLRKALYGLKQSPRVWYMTLVDFLHKLGFQRSKSDYGVFILKDRSTYIAVYVDDLLLFGSNTKILDEIQRQLSSRFKMTDLGEISHYLGMEVDVASDLITLRQTTYIKKILDRFDLSKCAPVMTPMEAGLSSLLLPSTTEASPATKEWYQSAIGSLMWPAMHTRPDIAFAVALLSKYNSNPSEQHCKYVRRIFAYLNGTLNHGITFTSKGSKDLIGYSDSDFAGAIDGRKSTGAFVYMLAGGPISHQSKKQSVVALSSCEAEYMALGEAGKEAVWLNGLLSELGQRQKSTPILIRGDNQGALALTDNPEYHRRTKHIDIRYHWLRERKERGLFILEYVPTKHMAADGLTKPLPAPAFKSFIKMLGLDSVKGGISS